MSSVRRAKALRRTSSESNYSSLQMISLARRIKVPVLLSAVGGTTYGLLRNLLAPTSPKDKSFNEIVKVLKAHFEPKPVVIAERFHFHRRDQAPAETVAVYVTELRCLATTCDFGDT